ncbi:MAG: four helix bundle protein [Bacteroidia bacterium]
MKIVSYKELIIWQRSIQLTLKIYKETKSFPKEELFGMVNQMRRAASSVPANIAEGWNRNSNKSLIYFLSISKGSLGELNTFTILAEKLGFLKKEISSELQDEIDLISKKIFRLQQSLQPVISIKKEETKNQSESS